MSLGGIFSLLTSVKNAARVSKRSAIGILTELIKLRLSVARLGASEYFDFRLYENDLSLDAKKAFGGYRIQYILEDILVDDYSKILSLDKISCHHLLQNCGIATAAIVAIYGGGPRPGQFPALSSPQELEKFLSSYSAYPLYLKPSYGSYGAQNTLLATSDGKSLALGDGSVVAIPAFCASLKERSGLGWIFQETLRAHPDIAELCGTDKVSGMRVHSFLTPKGAKIVRAIWKINVGKLDSDNFKHGASGNMLAAIDLTSGTVRRVVAGVGTSQVVDSVHPVTQKELIGFKVPHWQQIRDLVLTATPAFPGFLSQGWDIAICPDMPRALEVNVIGDIDLPQHSYRRGFLDEDFLSMLRERGLDSLLAGPAREYERNPRTFA